jgi:uncharacterized protein YndB with AHSA1/START domain
VSTKPITASVLVDAEPREVFEYFIRPEAMVLWMGQYASLDPRPGGRFAIDVNGASVRGRFLELDPPNRIAITWGFVGSDVLPPGASIVEVRLSAEGVCTRVQIVHRELPDSESEKHASGWPRFLGELVATMAVAPRSPTEVC